MKKKIFSVLFALVLVLSLSLVTAAPVAAATINVPGDYATIQLAVNAAGPGDTIIVADGTYDENIVVDKSLTIQAAGSAAIIDGGGMEGPGVHITAADVTFQGFTVTDFTCDPFIPGVQSGAGMGAIWVVGDCAVIDGNIVNNIRSTASSVEYPIMWPAGIGIDVAASGVEVTNNLVHDVDSIGIRVRSDYEEAWPGNTLMTGILVEGNTVYNTANTGFVVAGKVTGLTIKDNEIHDSLEPNPYSLWILAFQGNVPSDVTVEGNTISDGYINVRVWGANNINILGNTITDFVKGGIVVKDTLSVQIEGNIISTMSVTEASNGIQIGYEIDSTATTGTIKDNQVSGCRWDGYNEEGYEVAWTSSGILVIAPNSALEISGNEVQNNDVGLDIETGPATFMENNDVHNNSYGFVLWNADPTINFNNIFGNSVGGVYRAADGDPAGILDAENNWWGDISGPDYEGTAGEEYIGGTGDKVSANVDYAPWLTRKSEIVVDANIAYLGIPMVHLNTGWNTFSTPFALDPGETIDGVIYSGCDTWGDYVALGDGLSIHGTSPAYAFDPTATSTPWVPLIDENADYPLTPCDAIYVRMAGPDVAAILFSPEHSVPTKEVYQGWNLVGLAWYEDMPVEEALGSLYKVPGDLTGYSQVVSPPLNQAPWVFVRDGDPEDMYPTQGYWVFMENGPDTLAGFTFTPMSLD